MKLILPFLLTGLVSAQQCIEPQQLAPIDAAAVAAINGFDDSIDLPEEEFFEKLEKGWIAGSTEGGHRIGTWWFYQDKDNWKKVTYKKGEVLFWQKLVAGRRLFEFKATDYNILEWHVLRIMVYELDWNKDKTLDWKLVDELTNYEVINEHGHFLNADGTPSKARTHFGKKYEYGDKFDESIMGIPLK
jgi:hypothetical protein